MPYFLDHPSPIGPLRLVSNGSALIGCYMATPELPEVDANPNDADPILHAARRQLDAYFGRDLRTFTLPLAPTGTPFQQQVWAELQHIPFGETISYGELARRIGNPAASRAVGLANGQNPLGIIVPCHRVIGATGKLTGYGGGMPRKAWLLDHERGRMALPL